MRIAGGTLRGCILAAPPDGVLRPTQDAVREALFSMLAAVLPGASFLVTGAPVTLYYEK